ncbi:MAG: CHU large protein [Bacteroidetes bacterium]|nr:MAG: CHU large protein [Bacteroidota bacterium]
MKRILLFLLASFSFLTSAKATHIVGGTLTYVYNGGSSYTFTLKLFRDCSGGTAAFPNTVTITVAGYNGATFAPSRDFTMALGPVTLVPSNLDTCAAPPNPIPCVEEGLYTTTVTNLPPNPGGYHCYYDVCCRNLTTTNIDASCNCIGATVSTDIPGPTMIWLEDFTLANGTTVDAGATAWTRTLGTPAPGYAQVQNNLFEVQGVNNAQATWLSQQVNISTFTAGANLSVSLSEAGTLEANDSVLTYYSINSGPFLPFTVNGAIANDFTNAVATAGPFIGNTVQIMVRVHYDGASPTSELYRWDNVQVSGNDFISNSSPSFTNFPPLFLCQGTPFTFNHAATDADGDSLAYGFYTPFNDVAPTYANNVISFTPVTWLGGYSATNPLGGPPLTINPTTGLLSGTPTIVGQFVVGILVREYRNGVLINTVYRDFQFNVVFCPPPAQALIVPSGVINACGGVVVNFPNNSSVSANNWFWNFGDGSTLADTSNLQYPTYTYPSVGTYTVTMIINRGTPCADTSYATVYAGWVDADFTNNAPVCVGSPVTFTNTTTFSSNATITGWSWDFGDSQTSTAQSPTHTYGSSGTYTVQLIATSNIGCIDTISYVITINPTPTGTPANNGPLCAGSTLNLSTPAVPGATYAWTGPNSFSSSAQNPSIAGITLAGAGTYSLTVTANGCTSPVATTTVVVNPAPAAPTASSNSPICVGSTLNLTASNIVGATYSWTGPNSFTSSAQNPSIAGATLAASGTYSVTATVSGCTGPAGTVTVTVSPIPATPTASSNSPICAGNTLNLTASNIVGATYSWTGPNSFTSSTQNPSIAGATVAASGTYSVTATVAGCTGLAGTVNVTVSPIPAAPTASSNSPICAGTTLNLTASNIVGATYAWTGPNGFTSSTQNPSIAGATVAASGTYSVTATVGGCAGPAGTVSVTVNPAPAAPTASSNSPICAGSTLNLTASNIVGATYSWTGPNSFTSSTQNPSIAGATTAASGTYSVTATVAGCTGIAGTVLVTVNGIPAAPTASSNSPICAGSTLNLTASNIVGATYSWTGPNGFTSSSQNPSIVGATVAASGTYSVTATVAGCTGTAGTVAVTVNPIPAAPAASSNSPICAGSTLNLSASNIVGATYSWTGPNLFLSTSQNPSIVNATTAATGTYSVTVTVNGCNSPVATTVVTVNAIPATPAPASNSPICVGQTLNLTTSPVVGATYSWTGPNSFSSAVQNPSIAGATVAASGTYSLVVTVNGCSSLAGTVTVTVNTPPASPAAASNSPVCTGTTLNLTASLIVGATYSWTGPNGFTSTLQNPNITNVTAAAAGTYTVTANNGCASAPATVTVVVNTTPAAPTASSNSPICNGSTLNLNASNVVGATYSWTGPNGFTSSTQNPSIVGATTAASGTYSVTVTLNGCTSLAGTVAVSVNPIPAAPAPSSNSPVCTGNTLSLTTSAVVGATYSWTGPNGFTSSAQNPNIANVTLAANGTYSLTVTVLGCTSSAGTVSVTVNPTPAAPTASSNSPICDGSTLNLNASNVVGATYAWTGPNSFTDTQQNPSIVGATTAASGTYSVTVTVNGCVSSAGTVSVTVNPIPATPAPGTNSPVCVGQTLNFTTNAVVGATYSWSGPNGFSSAAQNPSIPGATSAASGTYSLIITVNGCSSIAGTVNATVNSTPMTPVASGTSPVCEGSTLQLSADTIPGATYSWTGPNGFTSTLQNPAIINVTLAAAGTYTVVANNGCASVPATVTITVNPTPATPAAGANTPLCAGSTLNLTTGAVVGATYSWTGPNGFSASTQNTSIPNATPAEAGTYSVTVTVNGCTSIAGTVTVVIDSSAIVAAGTDQTICANNASVPLSASSSTGAGTWASSGSGTFVPNNTTPNATYNPSSADTAAGSVTLTFTSSNNGACAPVSDQLVITITDAPTVSAGTDQTVCANNAVVTLGGSFTISTGASWSSSGGGTFAPSNTAMNATYTPDAADTAAGTVTIYLSSTGNGLCLAALDSMIITITDAPVANAGGNTSVCINNPNVSLNGTSSTGTGTWSTSGSGSFTPSVNSLTATYTPSPADLASGSVLIFLNTTNNGNCLSEQDTMTVTFAQPPTVTAGNDVTVCANNAAVVLTGTSTTGSGTWTSSGSGTFTPNPNTLNATYNPSPADTAAGTVTLTLTSTNNGGCLAVIDQLVVTITDAPTAVAGADQTICANNATLSLNGSVVLATGGTWSTTGSGTFSPSNTALNATYTASAADTAAGSVMIILSTTGNGLCNAATDTMLVTITDAPNVNAGPDIISCLSNPNTPLNAMSTTGSGTWTTSGSGTFSPNANTLNATYIPSTADTTAGSVTLIFTSTGNGNCLAESDTLLLQFAPVPVVTTGADQTVCANNATVLLSATSSTGSGIWTSSGSGTFTPNNTTFNATYIPSNADTAAGTVTLTFTATNACTPVSQNVIITITPAPFVDAGPALFTCANNPDAAISAVVSGGSTSGTWTSSGSGTFMPDNSSLNVTYSPSVPDIIAGSVTPPSANAGTDLVACANNPVQLNGTITAGNGTGIWTTPNGSGTFSPSDTTLNAFYTPVNADTSVSPVMLILTSTNNGGCFPAADTMYIQVNPGPEVIAGADVQVCSNNANVSLNGSVIIATGGVWTTGGAGTFLPDSVTMNATYVPDTSDISAGAVTLYLTSTGNGLCNAVVDSMLVTFTPSPVVNAGSSLIVCTGTGSVSLGGTITGGATTGLWTTGGDGTFSPNDSTLNATYTFGTADTTAGTVTLYLASTNNGNCLAESDSITITITPIPASIAGNDTTVCINSSGFALNGQILGGSGTGVWSTSGDGTFVPDSAALNATYIPGPADTSAGTVMLILAASNACLPALDTVILTFAPAPVVAAGADALICAGEPVPLNGSASNSGSIQWFTSGNGVFVPSDTVLNATYIPGTADTTAGSVIITLTSSGNAFCSAISDSMVITINTKPNAAFASGPACMNAAVLFTDQSSVTLGNITAWQWTAGTDTSSQQNPSFTFANTGIQTVTLVVTTAAGCSDTSTQTLNVNALPQPGYTSVITCPTELALTDSSFMSPGTIVAWNWNFGDSTSSVLQNPTQTYGDTGYYVVTLTVTSDSGCVASYSDSLLFVPCSDEDVNPPAVPSAFTPNGDGHNDILFVRGGPFSEFDFRIFNEWGNMIFDSQEQATGWDGTYKGKTQPGGTYVWVFIATTVDGEDVNITGNVTIIR